jgi:hypothetical protein
MKSCCKENSKESVKKGNVTKWLKGLGVVGFTFFLIKGLLWLAIFYGGLKALGF